MVHMHENKLVVCASGVGALNSVHRAIGNGDYPANANATVVVDAAAQCATFDCA